MFPIVLIVGGLAIAAIAESHKKAPPMSESTAAGTAPQTTDGLPANVKQTDAGTMVATAPSGHTGTDSAAGVDAGPDPGSVKEPPNAGTASPTVVNAVRFYTVSSNLTMQEQGDRLLQTEGQGGGGRMVW